MNSKIRGFTLLETLIAMMILSAALILLSNAWGGAFRAVKKSRQQHEVSLLLERKITELELEFKGKPLSEIPEEREEDFGKNYPDARWKMQSKEFEFPDLGPLVKSQNEQSDPMIESAFKEISETINKSIKEVKVTVILKDGPLSREYSAVTYFMDFDQSASMGGMGLSQ